MRLRGAMERAEVERDTVRERADAEADGRIREGRENEDVRLRELRVQGDAARDAAVASVAAAVAGVVSMLKDDDAMRRLVMALALVVLAFFASREGATYVRMALLQYLSRPRLLREVLRAAASSSADQASVEDEEHEDAAVLEPETRRRLLELTTTAASARCSGAPFRNALFYGPPGTGKTMAARGLARASGLDCAIMTGGDVLPLGGDAVTQLHAVFNWAKRSRRGLLLFIDEADSFLASRGGPSSAAAAAAASLQSSSPSVSLSATSSEGTVAALNALLYHTGEQSSDFMLVLATNRPDALDEAVLNRMDESIAFSMPAAAERRRILMRHVEKYVGYIPERDVDVSDGQSGVRSVPAWSEAWPVRAPRESSWYCSQLRLLRNACFGEKALAVVGSRIVDGDFLRLTYERFRKSGARAVRLTGFGAATISEAVSITEGLSGRELAKACSAVQCRVFLNAAAARRMSRQRTDSIEKRGTQKHNHHKRAPAADEKKRYGESTLSSTEFLDVLRLKRAEHNTRARNFGMQCPAHIRSDSKTNGEESSCRGS